jgi:serine O-acetyltransferase
MTQATFIQQLFDRHQNAFTAFPDKELAEDFINQLFAFLFMPKRNSRQQNPGAMEKEFESLKSHFSSLVYDVVLDGNLTQEITGHFFNAIPEVYSLLYKDAETIRQFDPAAKSVEEVLVAYPGFFAIAVYRLSHLLWKEKVRLLPRLFTEYAHSKTGIDIHPGAQIGESFFIDHGTGIVIGETTLIGNHVKIYQGVTIGALHAGNDNDTAKRHPTIEDHVIIYSGATILGGQTVIGHNSIIAGNVWLTNSIVPPFSLVSHKSEISGVNDFR